MFTVVIGCTQNNSTLFQCQQSSDDNSLLRTPGIPDFYFSHSNIEGRNSTLNTTTALIYTLPSLSEERNCTGTVQTIQYCYEALREDLDANITVFSLLLLTRNGLQFVVNEDIEFVSTPRDGKRCVRVPGSNRRFFTCCDEFELPSTVNLPASNFTFAIVMRRPLLKFTSSISEFEYPFLQAVSSTIQSSAGFSFTLQGSDQVNGQSFPLLRMFIGMYDQMHACS